MRLSIVIPVYNEKETILELISRVNNVPLEKEIIIVDDYSTGWHPRGVAKLFSQ